MRTLAQAAQEWKVRENMDLVRSGIRFVDIFQKAGQRGRIPDDVMASLEWGFLPLFRFSGRQALALQRALSTTPKSFVEVLRALYRPSKESGIEGRHPPIRKGRRLSQSQAYELLRDWRRLPGLD